MSVAAWIEAAIGGIGRGSIVVTELSEANLRWANNALTTNGQMSSRTATVIVSVGDEDVVVSGPVDSAEDLAGLVVRAGGSEAGSSSGGVDEEFALPGEPTSIEVFAEFARGLGESFADARDRGALLFGFAEHQLRTTWVATSDGVRRRAVVPMGRLELNGKSSDLTNSAWVGQATNDFTDVDIAARTAEVWERLGWGETRIDLAAGRYEVLLPPGAVADLLIYAYWTMNGRDAREGRNVFSAAGGGTRVGERLSQLPVSMWSDPESSELPCAPFAIVTSNEPGMLSVRDNGEPVGRVDWLADGVLGNLIEPRTASNDTLVFPTENLLCEAGGSSSLGEMIAATERGLLLTCLWYIREVDPQTLLLTGLTRDGVYLVEHGRVVGAVNNFRFNESPVGLLGRATEASVSELTLCREWNDYFTKTMMPALRIPDFNMSTVSRAT